MKTIKENYVPPDKQAYSRGQGKYMPYIQDLLKNKPGTVAIECGDARTAKLLSHAASRHLRYLGKFDKLRPRVRKDAEDCVKVWVVEFNA